MGTGIKAWWRGRSVRERRLIAVMGALAAIVLGWLLVLRPLSDGLAAARERHGAAIIALAEARARAAEIERLQKQETPGDTRPVSEIVGESAAAAGFPVAGLAEAGGGGVRLTLESARPQAFFGWVAQMEAQGLVVVELNARPNTDRTLAAEVTFRRRQP